MPSPFTDQQLQDTWNRYVGLNQADVISLTNPESAAYDASFANAIGYIYANRLFGFADYNYAGAGSNQFRGNNIITNGPIKS